MKCKKHWSPLIAIFTHEVSENGKKIDPDNEHDWRSLTLGWALAKGLEPNDANDFAIYVRYNTELA